MQGAQQMVGANAPSQLGALRVMAQELHTTVNALESMQARLEHSFRNLRMPQPERASSTADRSNVTSVAPHSLEGELAHLQKRLLELGSRFADLADRYEASI